MNQIVPHVEPVNSNQPSSNSILDSLLTNPINPVYVSPSELIHDFMCDGLLLNRNLLIGKPILRLVVYLLMNYNAKSVENLGIKNIPSDEMLLIFLQIETIPIELGMIEGFDTSLLTDKLLDMETILLNFFYELPQVGLGTVNVITHISNFIHEPRPFETYPIEYLLTIRGFTLIPQINDLFTDIIDSTDINEVDYVSHYLSKISKLDEFLMSHLTDNSY